MRNDLYVYITGTVGGEAKRVDYGGMEGVVCYVARETDGHIEGNTLILGRLGDREFISLLGAILRAVGPAMFARILLKSIFDRSVHYGKPEEA